VLSDPGRLRYDPRSRRRVRRLSARLRPLLLPVALVICAFVLADRLLGTSPAVPVDLGPAPPAGSVLVAVSPADPAVLGLASPGSLVDVYAAGTAVPGAGGPEAGTGDGTPGGSPARSRLLVSGALVMGTPGGGVAGLAGPSARDGPLGPGVGTTAGLGAGPWGSAVTLAVSDDDAAVLAQHTGGGFVLAVRAGPVDGSVDGSAAGSVDGSGDGSGVTGGTPGG
jgi:hypothetical protein